MFFKRNLPGLLWAGFIFFLSVIPKSHVPKTSTFEGADKLVHFILYGVLSFLLAFGFSRQFSFPHLREYPIRYAVGFSIVYGILIEFLQGTVFVSRSTEVLDMLANAVGALVGVFCFRLIYGKLKN